MSGRESPLVVRASLADTPLDAGRGIARIARGPVTTRGAVDHGARVERLEPELEDGRRGAPPPSCLVEAPRPGVRAEGSGPAPHRVDFEHDGHTLRAQVPLPAGTHFYGLGLVCGPLAHQGRRVVFWNTDAWRYDERTPSLYQSHPWILALLPDGRALGVLVDSPCRGQAVLHEDGLELAFEGGSFDLYLVEADHPEHCLRALGDLVGTAPLPPLWALGYHQCRWGYRDAERVLEVARELRARELPCDALWLDIDHMDRHRSLTFDPERFPDPARLTAALAELGFQAVAIVDPGLAASEDCELFLEARAGGHLVALEGGSPALGRVWPGLCAFPDFTRAATRTWWAERVRAFAERGNLAGLWCDMNEPAVQRTPAGTLSDQARHGGLGGGPHARFHNVYGELMSQATREGLAAARPRQRPFVLTRSSRLGGARHAATWTGDNQATWRDLSWSIPMVLNLGLSGQPYAGADVGGFDGDPSPELFARWFELGALLPFFRGHSTRDARDKEPWAFGGEVEGRVRAALELRMQLLPYLYTLFEEASRSGLPVARPLFLADPQDPSLREVDDAFLLGRDLLVAPGLEPGQRRRAVPLPRGGWYDLGTGARIDGPRRVVLPLAEGTPILLARAGAILPLGAPRSSSAEPLVELSLHVFLDAAGRAGGGLYEDAGDGEAQGPETWLRTRWTAESDGAEVRLATHTEGAFRPAARALRTVVRGGPAGARLRFAP